MSLSTLLTLTREFHPASALVIVSSFGMQMSYLAKAVIRGFAAESAILSSILLVSLIKGEEPFGNLNDEFVNGVLVNHLPAVGLLFQHHPWPSCSCAITTLSSVDLSAVPLHNDLTSFLLRRLGS